MPLTFELLVDVAGVGEIKPYVFSFVNQLSELGSAFFLTGTPIIEVAPDANLAIGTPTIDGTQTLVQVTVTATVAAAQTGNYRLDCRAQATDGVHTYTAIVRGNLNVIRVT